MQPSRVVRASHTVPLARFNTNILMSKERHQQHSLRPRYNYTRRLSVYNILVKIFTMV